MNGSSPQCAAGTVTPAESVRLRLGHGCKTLYFLFFIFNNGIYIIEELIQQFVKEAQAKFEQALIDACMRKGFVLNIASAPDFHVAEYKGTVTLFHTVTMTAICI